MTKRIIRKFRFSEISAVDRPAQAGAVATILKNDVFVKVIDSGSFRPYEPRRKPQQRMKQELHEAAEDKEKDTTKVDQTPTNETMESLAKAIEQRYGCSPADALKSAHGVVNNPQVCARVVPRIIPQLAAINKQKELKQSGESFVHNRRKDRFPDLVREIKTRDKCSNQAAMSKARHEHPEEYAAYQA